MNKQVLQTIFRGLASALCLATGTVTAVEEGVSFQRDVLPILSENCFHCHGPDAAERKADLRLDTMEGSRAALARDQSGGSAFLQRIHSTDLGELMPPSDSGKKLSPKEIAILKKWIDQGAVYEAHWAFQPIKKPEVPANGAAHPVDAFILRKLRKEGLDFSNKATRQQLIRRASFALTGLPPAYEQVEKFLQDESPDAFARVVDQLLDSPAYGEHWGRHWLDLARYADTHGGSAIGFVRFPFSYTYRDYVISAFNQDLAYDRFLLEQIAADQLKLDENDPALAALGFLTVGRQFRNVHDRLDDQIDVISRGLLGLTVSCARCHDHKFDPISISDYYSLHAALSNSRAPGELPLAGSPEIARSYAADLQKAEHRRDSSVHTHGEVFRGRLRMQVGLYLRELARGTPEQDTSTFFLSFRTEDLRPIVLERWRKYLASLDENDPVFGPWHRLAGLEKEGFAKKVEDLTTQLTKENGDPKKFAAEHQVATKAPKWNPRVLEALTGKKPKDFVEVADIYGKLFGEVHQRWLTALLEASLEAAPGGKPVPDQDSAHRVVNSAIEQQLRHHLFHPDSPTSLDLTDLDNRLMLNRGVRDSVGGKFGAISNLNLRKDAPPRSMVLQERPGVADPAFVFLRGNPVSRGEPVRPRFLSILQEGKDRVFLDGERRLGLARAIVDPDNSLTSRVVVNWVWQHHFGQGLVQTADDFGTRGTPPSHPELLDYLASRFQEEGWSIRKLQKLIVLSGTWQQVAREDPKARQSDPENRLLWRMPTRKLSLESMRDSLLAVSGELQTEDSGGQHFEEKQGAVIPRRSVYAFVNRDVISGLASTFDGADPSACTVKRPETMVPQQTLYALNSEYIQERARILAERPELKAVASDKEKIRQAYRLAFSRDPNDEEIAGALRFLESADAQSSSWAQLVHALLASNEFHFVD